MKCRFYPSLFPENVQWIIPKLIKKTANINTKKQQFIQNVIGDGSKAALYRRVRYFLRKVSIIQVLFKLQWSFHRHIFSISSDSLYRQYSSTPTEDALHRNSKSANILKVALWQSQIEMWLCQSARVTFRWRFSYLKAAQYFVHSTGGCATSRQKSRTFGREHSLSWGVATRSSQMTLGRTCWRYVAKVVVLWRPALSASSSSSSLASVTALRWEPVNVHI